MTGSGAIYVVRHGETTWNAEGRRQGSLDSPLTERGVKQAVAAGRALRQLLVARRDVVLECSPLGRARRTAEILCRELGWPETAIVIQPLLAELRQGTWEGLTPPEIDARYPGARAARERDKGAMCSRVARATPTWRCARAPGSRPGRRARTRSR